MLGSNRMKSIPAELFISSSGTRSARDRNSVATLILTKRATVYDQRGELVLSLGNTSTLANKFGDVRIFLKEFGDTKLLNKNVQPRVRHGAVVAYELLSIP